MKHSKLLVAAVVVALVLAAFATYKSLSHDNSGLTAAATPGTNYIENYSPAVLYNGGISSQLPIQTTSTMTAGNQTVGTNGTNISFVGVGSCTLGTLGPSSINTSHAATTTKVYDCPFTGVLSGDVVSASISTSTVMGMAGWSVSFAKASTTAGYVEVGLYNGTGAAAVPSASAVGSSTVVQINRAN